MSLQQFRAKKAQDVTQKNRRAKAKDTLSDTSEMGLRRSAARIADAVFDKEALAMWTLILFEWKSMVFGILGFELCDCGLLFSRSICERLLRSGTRRTWEVLTPLNSRRESLNALQAMPWMHLRHI